MLVWKAISSMFFTIFEISRLDVSIDFMATVMSSIVRRPVWAASRAWLAKSFAFSAFSAVARIIAEISSSEAPVSVTEAPCSLHPVASDRLAAESCDELDAVWSAPCCSDSEIPRRVLFVLSIPAWMALLIDSRAACVERTVLQPIRVPTSVEMSIAGMIVHRVRETFCPAVSASLDASAML